MTAATATRANALPVLIAASVMMSLAMGMRQCLGLFLPPIGIACTGSSLAMTATARAASPERRSVVLGIVGAFSSVGTLVIAPVLQAMLGAWDWRWGAMLFVLFALAMVPAAMITGRVDRLPLPSLQRASAAAAIREALRNRRFVVLCCTHFVCGLQLIFINTHLPNYLALCGQDPMLGATALAIIGGINIAGCLLAGYLGQRHLKNVLLGLTYLARSVVLMIYFLLPPTTVTTILFAAAMGMLWLGVIPLVSGYVADLFGTRNMATLLGVSFVIHQMGSVIGAWGGGMIFDMFGNYDLAWRFGVTMGIAAGLVQILFGGPSGTWSGTRTATAAG